MENRAVFCWTRNRKKTGQERTIDVIKANSRFTKVIRMYNDGCVYIFVASICRHLISQRWLIDCGKTVVDHTHNVPTPITI